MKYQVVITYDPETGALQMAQNPVNVPLSIFILEAAKNSLLNPQQHQSIVPATQLPPSPIISG